MNDRRRELGSGEVHVWVMDAAERRPDASASGNADHATIWGFVRETLAGYIGKAPDGLCIVKNEWGKPALRDEVLEFSLSHSDRFTALAVSHMRVGVDIEVPRQLSDALALARRFFSAEDAKELERVPDVQRDYAFLVSWTRKEAVLKGLGIGISGHLNQLGITCAADQPVSLLGTPWNPEIAKHWRIVDLDLGHELHAALAVETTAMPRIVIRQEATAADDRPG